MSAAETAYGINKRLAFCTEVVAQTAPRLVIDVGCGTGTRLTRPLAEQAPATRFVGLDSDEASLEYARRDSPPANLTYCNVRELGRYKDADLIIVSEVLEHVEDPHRFLAQLRTVLGPSGRLLLTVPNGWGPFEIATLFEMLFRVSGVFQAARRLKRWVADSRPLDRFGQDTLALSPHLHFFSWRQLQHLLASTGLAVRAYRGRTFLCGFLLDPLLGISGLIGWNARVADRLPRRLVSGWMFVLEPSAPVPAPPYRAGAFNRWRRRLNEKRWCRS